MAGKANDVIWQDFDSTMSSLLEKPMRVEAAEVSREEGEASDTDPEDACSNCSAFSHKTPQCQELCRKCDGAQHTKADCPIFERTISNPASSREEETSEEEDECRICQKEDHKTEECPDFKCLNCGVQGHSKTQCTAPEFKIKVASFAKLTEPGLEPCPAAENPADTTNLVNGEKEVAVNSPSGAEKDSTVEATPAKSLPNGNIFVTVSSDKRTAVATEPLERSKSRQSSGKSSSDGSSSSLRSKRDESSTVKSSKSKDSTNGKRSRSKESERRNGAIRRSRSKDRSEPSEKRRRQESKGTSASRSSREPRTRERYDRDHRPRSRSRKRQKNDRSRSRNRENSRERGKRRRTQSRSPTRKPRIPTSSRTDGKTTSYQYSSSVESYSAESDQRNKLMNAPDFLSAATELLSGAIREDKSTKALNSEAEPLLHQVRPNLKVIATDAQNSTPDREEGIRVEKEMPSQVNRILEIDESIANTIDESMLNNISKAECADKILYTFDHELSAIIAKKKIISSYPNLFTSENDIAMKPTDLKEEILILQKESEYCIDKAAHKKFMYLAVSLDKISACSVTSGLGESPIHLSMYSRGGSFSCYVPPYSFLQDGKKKPLLAKSGCKMTSKECLEYTDKDGKKVDILISQKTFVNELNKILRRNLKKYDATNIFDDCLLVFEDWKDASIFFNWMSFSTDDDCLDSCSRVTVVENSSLGDDESETKSTDERCRLLHYKVERLVREKNFQALYDKSVGIPSLLPAGSVYMDSTPHNICVLSVKYTKLENTNVLTQIGCIILRPDATDERSCIQDINSFGKEVSPDLLEQLNIEPTDRVNTEASALEEILRFCQRESGLQPTTLVTNTSHNTLTVFLKAVQRHEKEKLFYSLFSNYTDLLALSKHYFSKNYDLDSVPSYQDLCKHLGIAPQEGSTNTALEMSKTILACVEKILTKFHMFFEIKGHSKPVSKLFFAEHKVCFAKASKDISIEANIDTEHTAQFSLRKGKASSPKQLCWSNCFSPHWKVLHVTLLEKEAKVQIQNLTDSKIFLKKDEKLLKIYETIDPLMVPAELVHEYRNIGTSLDDITQCSNDSLETESPKSNYTVAGEKNKDAIQVLQGRADNLNISSEKVHNKQQESSSQIQDSLEKACSKELESVPEKPTKNQDSNLVEPSSAEDPNQNLFISNRNEEDVDGDTPEKGNNGMPLPPGIHYDYQFMKKHSSFKTLVDAYHLYRKNEDHSYQIKEESSRDGDKINEYVYGCYTLQPFYDAFSSFEHLIECINANLSTVTHQTVSDHFQEKTDDVFSETEVFSDGEFVRILLHYNKWRDQIVYETNFQPSSDPDPEAETVSAPVVQEVEDASEKENSDNCLAEGEELVAPTDQKAHKQVLDDAKGTEDKIERNENDSSFIQDGCTNVSATNDSAEIVESVMASSDCRLDILNTDIPSEVTAGLEDSISKLRRFEDHEQNDPANIENDAEGCQVLLDSNSRISLAETEAGLKLETKMDIDEISINEEKNLSETMPCSICHFNGHKKEDCTYCRLCQRHGHKSQDCNYCTKCKTDGHRVLFCKFFAKSSRHCDQDISEDFNPDENFGDLYLCEVREIKDASMTVKIDSVGEVFISQKECDSDICLKELLLVSLTNATFLPKASAYIRLKNWEDNPNFFSGEIREIQSKTKAVVAFKSKENTSTAILPLDRIKRVEGKENCEEDLKKAQVKVIVEESDHENSLFRVSLCLIIPSPIEKTLTLVNEDSNRLDGTSVTLNPDAKPTTFTPSSTTSEPDNASNDRDEGGAVDPTSPEITIIDKRVIRTGTIVEMKADLGIIKTDFGKHVLFHTKHVHGSTNLNEAIQGKTKMGFKAVKAKPMIKATAKLYFNNGINIDLCAMLVYDGAESTPEVPIVINEYVLQSGLYEYMTKRLKEKTPPAKVTQEDEYSAKKETFLSRISDRELHPQCVHYKDIGLLCKDFYTTACTKTHEFCHELPEYAQNLVDYCENFLISGECQKAKCSKKNLDFPSLQNSIRTQLFAKRNKCRVCERNDGGNQGCAVLTRRQKEAYGLCFFVFQSKKKCKKGKNCQYLHYIPQHLGITGYVNNDVYRSEVAKIQEHCEQCAAQEGPSQRHDEEPEIKVEVFARPDSACSSDSGGTRQVKLVDGRRRSSAENLTLDSETDLRDRLSSQPKLVSYEVVALDDFLINESSCTVKGRVRARPEDLCNLLNKKVKIKQSSKLPRALEVEEAEVKVMRDSTSGEPFVFLDMRNISSRTQPLKAGSLLATAIRDTEEIQLDVLNRFEENNPQYDDEHYGQHCPNDQYIQGSSDEQYRQHSPDVQYRQGSPGVQYRQQSPVVQFRPLSPDTSAQRIINVGNLPNRRTLNPRKANEMKSDLKDLFSKYGQICDVQIYDNRVPAKGTVEFYDPGSVTAVLNSRPIVLHGCRLDLSPGDHEGRLEGHSARQEKESAKSRLGLP